MQRERVIKNPVLRGFNPDPSILRVGDDYYIATSTFEWFPGVRIHHSRDLIHWRLLTTHAVANLCEARRIVELGGWDIRSRCWSSARCWSSCARKCPRA